jgi:integrase
VTPEQAIERAPDPRSTTPALSPERAELGRQALEQEASSKAPLTIAAYRKDWRAFEGWCTAWGLTPLPASVETLRLFIAEQAKSKRPTTIYRRLAAIKLAHETAGYASPTGHPRITAQMEGVIRSDARARADAGLPRQRQVKAATIDVMRRMVAKLDRTTVIGQRDAALLLVGFAGGFRRSELVALRVADVDWTDNDGVKVTVRHLKTDQTGAGLTKPILRGADPDTCPAEALATWMAHTPDAEPSTPLFRSVNRHGGIGTTQMTPATVARIVKRSALAAGLEPIEFSGHSLRRGMATTAGRNGAHFRHIARLGGWQDGSRVLARYIDDGKSWNDTASGKLGL